MNNSLSKVFHSSIVKNFTLVFAERAQRSSKTKMGIQQMISQLDLTIAITKSLNFFLLHTKRGTKSDLCSATFE